MMILCKMVMNYYFTANHTVARMVNFDVVDVYVMKLRRGDRFHRSIIFLAPVTPHPQYYTTIVHQHGPNTV